MNNGSVPILTFPQDEYLVEDFEGRLRVGGMPFGKRSVIRFANEKFYYGRSGDLAIRVFDQQGNELNRITYPYQKVPVTGKDEENYPLSDFHRKHLDKLPDYWPAFKWFVVDPQDHIWVAVNTTDREHFSIKVLDQESTLVSEFKLSKRVKLYKITDDKAYGIKRDKEGNQSIVCYQIVKS